MLNAALLRFRKENEDIRPSYVDPGSKRYLARAELLVGLVRDARARQATRGELDEQIREQVIGDALDHRLTKGLVRVLLQQCRFEPTSPMPPEDLRRELFGPGPAARSPRPDGAETAADRIRLLGERLGCEPEKVARGLYADLDENHVLVESSEMEASELLHRYNLALVQGLLLHASALRLQIQGIDPPRARQVFRHARFHQLMHRILASTEGFSIEMDGPASLLKLSTRYGQQLALFFPVLPLQTCSWRLEADLRVASSRGRLVVRSEDALRSPIRDVGAWRLPEEEWFEERFPLVAPEWNLERGGELLNLGGEAVLVPDYTFRREGRVAWMEIIGVWRRSYLERRVQMLARHGRPNLILAVNRKLLGDDSSLEGIRGPIIPYNKAIPPDLVVKALEEVALKG